MVRPSDPSVIDDAGVHRISIDLDRDVKYESQRIATRRIYFDLANATLVSALSGKNYDVQTLPQADPRSPVSAGPARVSCSMWTAFPTTAAICCHPPRLVIDVHEPQSVQTASGFAAVLVKRPRP